MNEPIRPRTVRCPQCRGDSVYASSNPYRPFCSQRCKGSDLGAWASEQFRVAAAPDPNDPDLPDDTPPAARH